MKYMKKIGIVTITSARINSFNYGNILQNYALTEYLRNLNFNVETIYYSSTVPTFTLQQRRLNKCSGNILQFLDDIFRVINRKFNNRILQDKQSHRSDMFWDFINLHISYTSESYSETSDMKKLNSLFDFFIVGSDQVWNPYYEGSNEFFYLGFADKHKRLTYAPSIGVDHIPNEMIGKMRRWLNQIPDVSIREAEGKEILSSVFNLKSTLVCDPVFLLNKEQWLQVAKTEIKKDKYFVVYILGKKTVETKRYIKKLEKYYGLKSFDLYTRDDPNSLFCGPAEFIGLIAGAEFVFTDSFHGTAFSLIFERPVVIIDRNASNKKSSYKMNGRIDNILKLAGLDNRNVQNLMMKKENLYQAYSVKGTDLEKLICSSKDYIRHLFERNGEFDDKHIS